MTRKNYQIDYQFLKTISKLETLSDSNIIPSEDKIMDPLIYEFSEFNYQEEFNIEFNNIFNLEENKKDSDSVYENQDITESIKEEISIPYKHRIRLSNRRPRNLNQDSIRKKIKTLFFNNYILSKINNELKRSGSRRYFEKFPPKFVQDITRIRNKTFLEMTIIQIMRDKGLYEEKNKSKYYHNLKVLESLNEEKYLELKKILNTKYIDLFDEYINSDKFKKDLEKQKNKNSIFKDRYIFLSKIWIKFFS